MLALAQARGEVAFSVVPFHCAYTYTQYDTCQALSFAGGICARRCRRDLQSLPGITSLGRNSWTGNITLTGGAYSFGIPLIAARNGDDLNGRTYTIVVMGSDTIGNVGACSAVVTVPHDQGN